MLTKLKLSLLIELFCKQLQECQINCEFFLFPSFVLLRFLRAFAVPLKKSPIALYNKIYNKIPCSRSHFPTLKFYLSAPKPKALILKNAAVCCSVELLLVLKLW